MQRKVNIAAILVFALILRLFVMLNSGGSYHADEIFQTVEPAHGLIFGYWMKTWEWEKGIRSFFLPGIYAGLLYAGKALGIGDSLNLNLLIYLFNLALSLLGIYAVFVIGRESAGVRAGLIAAAAAAASIFLIKFAFRPLTEPVSMNPILLSLALGYKGVREEKGYSIALSGALSGLSFFVRFPSALFIMPLIVFIIIRRHRVFFRFAVPLCLVLFLGGMLDLAAWGSFLRAPVEFLKFNILENKSTSFGTSPAGWYLKNLFPNKFVTILTVIFFAAGAYRSRLVFSSFLVYLAVFSFIPHKEERFIIPLIPLSLILVSIGIERLTAVLFKRNYLRNSIVLLLIAVYSLYPSFKLKKVDLIPANRGMFLSMNLAGKKPDIKGLLYLGRWHDSGGYSYLNRNVPVLFCDPDIYPPERLGDILSRKEVYLDYGPYLVEAGQFRTISVGSINYAIARDSRYDLTLRKFGFVPVASFGQATLYRRIA